MSSNLSTMKTAGRHHHVNPPHPGFKSDRNERAVKPDRIIMPVHGTHGVDDHMYSARAGVVEYTDFEVIEASSSSDYDEMAFQEFATEDPTRLRVVGHA
jgi:hypothetical protein